MTLAVFEQRVDLEDSTRLRRLTITGDKFHDQVCITLLRRSDTRDFPNGETLYTSREELLKFAKAVIENFGD